MIRKKIESTREEIELSKRGKWRRWSGLDPKDLMATLEVKSVALEATRKQLELIESGQQQREEAVESDEDSAGAGFELAKEEIPRCKCEFDPYTYQSFHVTSNE